MKIDPARAAWMTTPEANAVMDALTSGVGEARFVGGAVRNTLLRRPVTDVDIATPLLPDDVSRRLQSHGLGAVPTGIDHGTITAVASGKTFEITTLRRDVSTDGRRATVAFTSDWREDASRRDFTINALYATRDGLIFDYFGGIADLEAGHVRFVGDPVTRIREDYLRALRLFRFHAWYGQGELDRAALAAAISERLGLRRLSGERVSKEFLRLLEAGDPRSVLHDMATSDILSEVLPVAPQLPRFEMMVAADLAHGLQPDALLRLAALIPADKTAAELTAARLKLSNHARERLRALVNARQAISPALSASDARKQLYRIGPQQFRDIARLRWAENAQGFDASRWTELLQDASGWQKPDFPLTGRDVMAAGVPEGPLVGRILSEIEEWWIESGFATDTAALCERLRNAVHAARE